MKGEHMDGMQVFVKMVNSSGKSRRALSLEMGKSENYLSSLISQNSRPTADTLALVAKHCGYVLACVPIGEELSPCALIVE